MTQLIIDGLTLPEIKGGAYACPETPLSEQIVMISGRMVSELRGGKVWRPSANYEGWYFTIDFWSSLSAVLLSGTQFDAAFLPDNGTELQVSTFLVESITTPSYVFSRGGTPYWTGLSFVLREVRPHA